MMCKIFNFLFVRYVIAAAALLVQVSESVAESALYGRFYFTPETPNTLYLVGKIQDNDDFDLRRALRDHEIQTLALISNGGSVSGGLGIAGIVGDRKLRTIIPREAVCASACSYIFLAGNERKANGALGVHQFASVEGARTETIGLVQSETQKLTAEILGFLREFETPAFVAEYMFRSLDMYWFNEDQLQQLNTEIFTLEAVKQKAINNVIADLISELDNINENKKSPTSEPNVKVETPAKRADDITEKEYISILQKRLNELNCEAGGVDGVLGQKTVSALKRFSKKSGIPYYNGIIFDENFVKALLSSPDMKCPVIKKKKAAPPVSPTPLKLASHWKISCSNTSGTVIFTAFARVSNYNNRNGNISFIVTDNRGNKRSMHGSIANQRIVIFDQRGSFNSNYTRFSLSDPDCPTKLSAIALY